jgi:uncharacterized membrane protein YqiK
VKKFVFMFVCLVVATGVYVVRSTTPADKARYAAEARESDAQEAAEAAKLEAEKNSPLGRAKAAAEKEMLAFYPSKAVQALSAVHVPAEKVYAVDGWGMGKNLANATTSGRSTWLVALRESDLKLVLVKSGPNNVVEVWRDK